MKSHRLFVFSPDHYGERRLLATLTFEQDQIRSCTVDDRIRPIIDRMVEQDFEETLGFPRRRMVRAKKGSLEALLGIGRYLASHGRFNVVLQTASVEVTARRAPRLTYAESSRFAAAALWALPRDARKALEQADELWRSVQHYKAQLALQYGYFGSYAKRLEGALKRKKWTTDEGVGTGMAESRPLTVPTEPTTGGAVSFGHGRGFDQLVGSASLAEQFTAQMKGEARAA